jgi:protein ImuB
LLFGSSSTRALENDNEVARNVAREIVQRATELNLKVDVAVATNPDVAIHAARSFAGITVIAIGEECLQLSVLSIKKLDYSLVGIEAGYAQEIQETFALWGIRTFGDLAGLPLTGVAERLGQEGVQLQTLAQGQTDRHLNLVRPPIGFEQSLELEHSVTEIEPLSFILSRLLNQLCANLNEYALATNELHLRLVTEQGAVATGSSADSNPANQASGHFYERTITLPVPMLNSKTLLRLLLFDIEAQPPQAPIVAVTITAEPVKPRASQTGLFIPLAPEPEKLEVTLARLAKLVGADRVGSPELLETHRPDAFRMKRFSVVSANKRKTSKQKSEIENRKCVMGFRIFRPPWRADVQTLHEQPVRINACSTKSSGRVRGKIVRASGPWRASGDWWRSDVWARDEWDVEVTDSTLEESKVLCRIYRDMASEEWFVAGVYD